MQSEVIQQRSSKMNEENVKGANEDVELSDDVLEDVSGGLADTNINVKPGGNVNIRQDGGS